MLTNFNFKKTSLISGLLFVAAALAVAFLDRPLAIYLHSHGFDQLLFLQPITQNLVLILTFLLLGAVIIRGAKEESSKTSALLLTGYIYICLQLLLELKVGLKIIFGRYWPKTWLMDNLSLINNGVYGFNWGHGWENQGSFPSGHSCYTIFCATWLYLLYPRLGWLCWFIGLWVVCYLVILDYHFLGDCLAGAACAYFAAIFSAWGWHKLSARIFRD